MHLNSTLNLLSGQCNKLSTWISCKLCLANIKKFQMRKLSISCSTSEEEISAMKIFFAIFWFIVNQNRAKVFRLAIHSCIFVVAVHWIRIALNSKLCFRHSSKDISKLSKMLHAITVYLHIVYGPHKRCPVPISRTRSIFSFSRTS